MAIKTIGPPEPNCPECGHILRWKTVVDGWRAPAVNSHCPECNIVLKNRESPEVAKGKRLEKMGITAGLHCMSKEITQYPCNVQIGILRQRMHPKGTEIYSPYCKHCEESHMQYELPSGRLRCSVCKKINSMFEERKKDAI